MVWKILETGIGWDDVKNVQIPAHLVRAGRGGEVGFMEGRNIWGVRDVEECWRVTGSPPVSVRWVDTEKRSWVNGDWVPLVRCRLVARDFKRGDCRSDDLFAESLPLEHKTIIFSRAATNRKDGRWRKMMFVDARKAHLNGMCEDDVYIELPEACGLGPGKRGKLNYWL